MLKKSKSLTNQNDVVLHMFREGENAQEASTSQSQNCVPLKLKFPKIKIPSQSQFLKRATSCSSLIVLTFLETPHLSLIPHYDIISLVLFVSSRSLFSIDEVRKIYDL